jgi:CHAT domain-containing protein
VDRINEHIKKHNEITEEDIKAVSGGYFSAYSLWSLSPFITNTPGELMRELSRAWLTALDEMTGWLWRAGIEELVYTIKEHNESAIFIPSGQLALLPLHAAWKEDPSKPTDRLYALDEISISYVPSAHALWQANLAAERAADSLMAVDNPKADDPKQSLAFSEDEVKAVLNGFDKSSGKHLYGKAATIKAVKAEMQKAHVLHFSTHGRAGWEKAEQAQLLLADNYLTLYDIFDLNLSRARLAVLSACETGVPSLKLIDEMFGLPAGMMQAGVPGVVGSLWSVNDLSTALLMAQFYKSWRKEGKAPQEALKQAQIWLRDKLIKYKSPFFWAAFAYTGI